MLNAIARIVLARRWYDVGFIQERVEGQTFEAYQRSTLGIDIPLDEFVAEAAQITGIAAAKIYQAAEWIAAPKSKNDRRRTLLHYEKGLIWGSNFENIAAIVISRCSGKIGSPAPGQRLGPSEATCDRLIPADGPRSTSTKRFAAVK